VRQIVCTQVIEGYRHELHRMDCTGWIALDGLHWIDYTG
jgi:hypothetical protein